MAPSAFADDTACAAAVVLPLPVHSGLGGLRTACPPGRYLASPTGCAVCVASGERAIVHAASFGDINDVPPIGLDFVCSESPVLWAPGTAYGLDPQRRWRGSTSQRQAPDGT